MHFNISLYEKKFYVKFIFLFTIFFFSVNHLLYSQAKPSESQVQLANGVYLVLEESENVQKIPKVSDNQALLIDKYEFSDAVVKPPTRYLLVSKQSYVPLVLESLPTKEKDQNGKTILYLRLEAKSVPLFKELTGKHIGSKAAVIIGGKVVTVHKIRSEIPDGRVQVTRCTDNACEILYVKLTESFHLK